MGISDWSSDVCSSDLSKSSKTSRPRSDRSRASARPRSFRYGDLAPGCTTRAILAPLNGDPVPAAALGVVEGFVGESIELLEIARRPHLGDPDARGDQPLAHRLAMIARRAPAADALDRKSAEWGKRESVRGDIGGRRNNKKKNKELMNT